VAAELLKHQHSSSAPVSAASLNSAQLQSLSINRATYCFDTSRSRYPAPQSLEFRRVLRRTASTNGNLGNGLTVTTAVRFCQLAKYRLSN
jgi:hypothetical protein